MSRHKDAQNALLATYQTQMVYQAIRRGMAEDQAIIFAAQCVAAQIELIAKEDAIKRAKRKPRTLFNGGN